MSCLTLGRGTSEAGGITRTGNPCPGDATRFLFVQVRLPVEMDTSKRSLRFDAFYLQIPLAIGLNLH